MRFSIITPSRNCGGYIADSIESVISQRGDFEIEYLVRDGFSTDGTAAIVAKYRQMLEEGSYPVRCRKVTLGWISEKDRGMYDAVNRGFADATGDVHAWLNADDIYLPGAFHRVQAVFEAFPSVRWIKGITSYIDANSAIIAIGRSRVYYRGWIAQGVYGRDVFFIQQDSVFWRADLWRACGPTDASLSICGDYGLWLRFAKAEPLVSVQAYLSAFREHGSQLSSDVAKRAGEIEGLSPSPPFLGLARRVVFHVLEGLPIPISNFLYRLLFPFHSLRVVTFDPGGRPVLRKSLGYIRR